MNDNVLTSYSFLAALSENETDIYKTVYLPLFKRAISSYAAKKSSKVSNSIQGTDIDIQSIILEEYGIEVPILIVRKLIKAVGTSLSKKERNIFKFDIFEDGKAFQFTNYNYFSTEEIYDRERRNAQALQQAFEDYLKSENLSEKNIPSFSQFIDKNKCNLSSFFSGKNCLIHDVEGSFMAHVNFLQHIEGGYHYLYQTAERIYLGSVIASFLETGVDLESKMDNNIIYYLDTQIVLEALDLQKAEDTLPTQELLKLIRATGGKIRLLDITINEIHKIIELAINNYSKSHPTTTVNEACVRIGKNKTWLISINGKLESFIKAELQVDIDGILETKMSLYSKSEDVNLLKQTRIHKSTAIHDVAAYLHVRDRREGNIRLFQKAKYWFVTANKKLADFNISRKTNGFVNETIMPEELTSLLFLKNPQKLAKKVSQIGLNELIAQTLSEEYASKELINEIDIAIKAATGNLAQESKTMALAEGRLDMYSGEDGLIVPLMSIGAKGVISVLSNVAPKQTHDICATFAAGDVAKAAQLQFKALELVDALFCEVNPIPVKHALNLMGWDMGPLRSPLCEMEEANLERLKKAMVNYGIL